MPTVRHLKPPSARVILICYQQRSDGGVDVTLRHVAVAAEPWHKNQRRKERANSCIRNRTFALRISTPAHPSPKTIIVDICPRLALVTELGLRITVCPSVCPMPLDKKRCILVLSSRQSPNRRPNAGRQTHWSAWS